MFRQIWGNIRQIWGNIRQIGDAIRQTRVTLSANSGIFFRCFSTNPGKFRQIGVFFVDLVYATNKHFRQIGVFFSTNP